MNNFEAVQTQHTALVESIDNEADYIDIVLGFINLAELVHNHIDEDPNQESELWTIGEYSAIDLASLIVAGYWHFTECHRGQFSKTYEALCSLGLTYDPGMTSKSDCEELEYCDLLERLAMA
tara:strand:+ start:554 stop:919 length:366 start_codon:yes stop_codon:yes gene_type:complete